MTPPLTNNALDALLDAHGVGDSELASRVRLAYAAYRHAVDGVRSAAGAVAAMGDKQGSRSLESWARGLETNGCFYLQDIVDRAGGPRT